MIPELFTEVPWGLHINQMALVDDGDTATEGLCPGADIGCLQ